MKPTKISYAVAAILNACAPSVFAAGAAADSDSAAAGPSELGEVVVTAQRREQSIQDVPITMQALTAETLTQLNATTFDDFIKYLPNVTQASNGPGQTNIYMRGLSIGSGGTEGSGAIGTFPNVAVYLDDQSAQLPGRNLDIYAVDLERIEVLEGPQGTLFGGGAQAGVLRYITNKPKLDVTEGSRQRGLRCHGPRGSQHQRQSHAQPSADPRHARGTRRDLRGSSRRLHQQRAEHVHPHGNGSRPGGAQWRDGEQHRPGTHARSGAGRQRGHQQLSTSRATRSIRLTYTGFRLSALGKINDDWNVLLTQSYQNMDAEGVFYQNPNGSEGNALPPLSVTLFNPSYDKDKFENTALTISGTDRQTQGRLRRRVSGAKRRSAAGLHELRPRRLGDLLPVHGLQHGIRSAHQVLLAKRDLARHATRTRTRATSCASARRTI